MSVLTQAKWVGPIANKNAGAMRRPLAGLVLHVQQGTESGTNAWFHDPSNTVASAHFGNPKAGALDQWIDTNDLAWAEMAGNATWISVENEGASGDTLTDNQVANCALLLAWLNLTEGVPLQVVDDVSGSGLGYHGMGGAAWGNHPNCPGQPIVDQRAAIVAAAQALVAAPVVTSVTPTNGTVGDTVTIAGSGFTFATSVGFAGTSVTQMSVDNDGQITVVVPDGSGTVDVEVVTLVGPSAAGAQDQFSFA